MVMKRKIRTIKNRNEAKYNLSRSFDNGEILGQESSNTDFMEYVVQQSAEDIPFEEYVVCNEQQAPPRLIADSRFGSPYRLSNSPAQAPNDNKENLSDIEKLNILDNFKSTAKSFDDDDIEIDTGGQEIIDIDSELEDLQADDSNENLDSEEDIFQKDMESILKGEKVFNEKTKAVEIKSASKAGTPHSVSKQAK